MMTKKVKNSLLAAILLVILIIYLSPIYLIVINSFKTYPEIMRNFLAFPSHLNLENYKNAFKALNFSQTLMNSIIITAVTVGGVIVTTSMASYKLARVKTKFSNFMYMFFTLPYLIPFFAYMIPIVKLSGQLGIKNSLIGVSLINIGTSGSFAIVMFCAAVKSIPEELDEAAYLDGCSSFQTFRKIIFPLMLPTVSSVMIIYTLWTWNGFMVPFLLLNQSKSTLIVKVYNLLGMYGSDWDIIIASLVITSLPIIILYALFQNKIISGITAGAVKG